MTSSAPSEANLLFDALQDPKVLLITSILGLIVTIFLVIFPILKLDFFKTKPRNAVLLLGQCGSGKTALFMQIVHKKMAETVSSLSPNVANLTLKNNKIYELVDFPGHRSIQHGIMEYLNRSKCIIFLIDAMDKTLIKSAAEQLFEIMSDLVIQENNIPIMIACNKYDSLIARPMNLIQMDLEREIESLRSVKRISKIDSSESDDENDNLKLKNKLNNENSNIEEDETFSFDSSDLYVIFEKISVKNGNFSQITDFINKQFE